MADKNTQPKQSNRQKDFIAEIKTQGLARMNRFLVSLTPPNSDPAAVRKTMLFCEKASLPGISYATTQNRSFGESRETPYDKLFEPVTLTFHVDRHMTVKKIFDDWGAYIQNPVDRSFQWYRNYITDLKIHIQDLEDKTTYEVVLYEAYPKTIGAIQLDAEGKDTMRVDVTFQYKYWVSNLIAEDANGHLLTADSLSKYRNNFSGFQETLRKGLGERGAGIVTGVVGQLGMRAFSQVTSRIPSIRF
jgi:hypothetical protein